MPIQPIGTITAQQQVVKNAAKRSADLTAMVAHAVDNVDVGGAGLANRIYTKHTIEQLQEMVSNAADKLGVDVNTMDVTPEGTSDLISNFAIGMYTVYRKQHPELSDTEALSRYETMIGKAVEKGYREAMEILDGMQVLDSNTRSELQRTHDLIFEKLDNFFADRRAELTGAET